jgi:GAF domain-containing protein
MAETLAFSKTADRKTIYDEVVPQIDSLVSDEPNLIANLANIAAVLKEAFGFFWAGFYLAKDGELVLGPFQGPLACTRIKFDQGVCGRAFTTQRTVIVPDVNEFPGHIVCSSAARSEIVVPVFDSSAQVIAVLDVDSDRLDDFSQTDADGLGKIVRIVESTFERSVTEPFSNFYELN